MTILPLCCCCLFVLPLFTNVWKLGPYCNHNKNKNKNNHDNNQNNNHNINHNINHQQQIQQRQQQQRLYRLSLLSLFAKRSSSFSSFSSFALNSHDIDTGAEESTFTTFNTDKDDNHDTNDNDNDNDDENHPIGLYIHIPYCRRRCRYCNFAIVPIGPNVDTEKAISSSITTTNNNDHDNNNDSSNDSRGEVGFQMMNEQYVNAILKEFKNIRQTQLLRQQKQQQIPIQSIYFGGGTPSLAPIQTIQQILHAAIGVTNTTNTTTTLTTTDNFDNFDNSLPPFKLLPHAEITIEMDPGTFSTTKLQRLQRLGINRISLGVQSFNDDILQIMGRIHRKVDILNAIQSIQTVFGGNNNNNNNNDNNDDHNDNNYDDDTSENSINYSIDLISGVPGLTLAGWIDTLQQVTSLKPRPKHLSIYDLQIEQGTVFSKWYNKDNKDNNENTDSIFDDNDKQLLQQAKQQQRRQQQQQQQKESLLLLNDNYNNNNDDTTTNNNNKNDDNQHSKMPFLPTEEDCAFMYKFASGYLKSKGYEHYEVSSYAYRGNHHNANPNQQEKQQQQHHHDNTSDTPTTTTTTTSIPKRFSNNDDDTTATSSIDTDNNQQQPPSSPYRSRHNQIYWAPSSSWYAIGLGASSFVHGKTVVRPKTMIDYLNWVNDNHDDRDNNDDNHNDNNKNNDIENDHRQQQQAKETGNNNNSNIDNDTIDYDYDYLTDCILKRLRTSDGLDLEWIQQRFGPSIVDSILQGAQLGLDLGFAKLITMTTTGTTTTTSTSTIPTTRRILRLTDPEGFLYSNFIISSIFAEL